MRHTNHLFSPLLFFLPQKIMFRCPLLFSFQSSRLQVDKSSDFARGQNTKLSELLYGGS